MLGLKVSVPIACWRKGHAREYLESEPLPPPATCYGFLLSLVGEEERERHIGVRVTAGLVNRGGTSVVLRTVWRVKDKKLPPGSGNNLRPDFQQVIAESVLNLWLDSRDEASDRPTLETRVAETLAHPERIERFGGLSLGESTHLVDEVNLLADAIPTADTFLLCAQGRMTLPIWVDHVGSAGTRRAVGDLIQVAKPDAALLPRISPL